MKRATCDEGPLCAGWEKQRSYCFFLDLFAPLFAARQKGEKALKKALDNKVAYSTYHRSLVPRDDKGEAVR